MSYIVLARKWRPQTFAEVIGQDHVTVTLQRAVEKGRLAHAYLFAGPRGCGKTTTARLLAKVINCENPDGAEPCNTCASCTAVTDGKHLDVIEIDGASNRGIDEIRDLREKIGYTATEGRSKIYIIDEVHMLTPQAFNALLKTLEEPPPHVYLIFATTEPHKVPPTILSRCQRFNFKKLELAEIIAQLEKICTREGIPFDREALLVVGRRAEGSMRDAESLLDQCISASGERVDLALVRTVLGLVDAQLVTSLLEAVAGRDRPGALAMVDTVVSSGLDLEEFFLAYIEGLRNLLVLSIDGGTTAEWLGLTKDELAALRRINEEFRTEDLLCLFRAAMRAFGEFKASSQPRYLLEATIAEAASWDSAVELSEILRTLEGTGGGRGGQTATGGGTARTGSAPAARRGGSSSAPDDSGTANTGDVGRTARAPGMPGGGGRGAPADTGPVRNGISAAEEREQPRATPSGARTDDRDPLSGIGGREMWERFISQVREAKLTLGIWLMSAEVVGVEGNRLVLSFSPQNRFASEMIREEKNRRYIESHLERFFGRKLIIATGGNERVQGEETGPETPRNETDEISTRTTAADGERPDRARVADPAIERLVAEQPVIKRLLAEFDGEIIPNEQYERRSG